MAVYSRGNETPWAKRFSSYLNEHSGARRALEKIEEDGFPRHLVLSTLWQYTAPELLGYRTQARRRNGRIAQAIRGAITALQRARGAVRTAIALFPADYFDPYLPAAGPHVGLPPVAASLQSISNELESLALHYHSASSEKGAGRDERKLVELLTAIEATTGKKHLADVAHLIDAATYAHGRRGEIDTDALRKIVARYKKNHPAQWETIRLQARVHPLVPTTAAPATAAESVRRQRKKRASNFGISRGTVHPPILRRIGV